MAPNTLRHPEKRIGLFYLKTGGGHYSAARALQKAIHETYRGNADALLFDPVPEDITAAQMLLQDGYRFTSHKIGKLWILLYEISKLKFFDYIWSFFVYITIRKNTIEFIKHEKIDTVVILHFLLSRPLQWTLKKMKKKPGLLRIVTDPFTAHDLWFNCPDISTIVFSRRLYRQAAFQFPCIEKSLQLFPPILGQGFFSQADPEKLSKIRKRFGFTGPQNYLLFAGGGEGFPKGLQSIAKLLKAGTDFHILLVCGKDSVLRARAEKLRRTFPGSSFTVFGYVDFMAELMQLADIVVSKGGPATIMEALTCGKPILLIHYLYGQERGNMEYVVRNRFGYFVPSPSDLPEIVRRLQKNPELYAAIQKRILNKPPQSGTAAIADYIVHLESQNKVE